ncbi:MAG TPA: DUF2804 family protein [Thermoleophilaceae bacterium]
MDSLPVRGPDVRALGLPLPPARMPLLRAGQPLKRWRYVGVYGPELMLCVVDASVAGVPLRWWAIALPDGGLRERTTAGRGGVLLERERVRVAAGDVAIDLALDEQAGVEVVSPHGRSYIWTRKQGGIPARGRVRVGEREWTIDGTAFVDDSAGYHARHTVWRWSAGLGVGGGGEQIAWNLVDGVHDAAHASERTVWVDGEPHEVGPVAFADDLSSVGELRFHEWSARLDDTNRLLFRSRYRQPFGTFEGTLPGGGPALAAGYGVMEWHDVRW